MEDNIINNIRSLFKLKIGYTAIKDRIIGDIRNIFVQEDYYKPVRVGKFWSNNYIEYEYESSSDRNKKLTIKNILIKLDHTQKIS